VGGRPVLNAAGRLRAARVRSGWTLQALRIRDLDGTDLSAVTEAGTVFRRLDWVPIEVADPAAGKTVRDLHTATPIPKCEGTWLGRRDHLVRVLARRRAGRRGRGGSQRGRPWRTDLGARAAPGTLRLVVRFEQSDDFEGPDNITVSPHGYAVICTDGDDANQFLAGITPQGQTFPLAHNRMSDEEFAGATFSPDGGTLFVNVQVPGTTFAIWGPWR
jgi:uncharacterized protein